MHDIPDVNPDSELEFLTPFEIATVDSALDVDGAEGSFQCAGEFYQESVPHRLNLMTCMLGKQRTYQLPMPLEQLEGYGLVLLAKSSESNDVREHDCCESPLTL